MLLLIFRWLPLAHDIASAAQTCRASRGAARQAFVAQPYSSEVVPLKLTDPEHKVLSVTCVAVARDGHIITGFEHAPSSSRCGIVKVWRNGESLPGTYDSARVHTIQVGVEPVVTAIAMLPDGAHFVSASTYGESTVKLWTLDGALERDFEVGGKVNCVAALPDGEHFLVGLEKPREIRLHHIDGTLVRTYKTYTGSANALVVTPDGHHIIGGCDDTLVKVWNVANKLALSTCAGHTYQVRAVAAMPDGQRILSGTDTGRAAGTFLDEAGEPVGGRPRGEVRVWLLDGTHVSTLTLPNDRVDSLVALPDNQHALAGSSTAVALFNVNDGAVLRKFAYDMRLVQSMALLPDGLRFVVCSTAPRTSSGRYIGTSDPRVIAHISYHGCVLRM